jgi:uncharacterized protein (UPF0332 family)
VTQSSDSTQLMQMADLALASARLLLDAGDTDGACNRTYYAMFDAARAPRTGENTPETTRTHNRLIAASGRDGDSAAVLRLPRPVPVSAVEQGLRLV